MYSYVYHSVNIRDVWNVWVFVATVAALLMFYGVWRLWTGRKLDPFERSLRRLRYDGSVERLRSPLFQTSSANPLRGQWSLLTWMYVCIGAALLLVQAREPSQGRRLVIWQFFVLIGGWHGASVFCKVRGVGPLRNFVLGGLLGGAFCSGVVWGFHAVIQQWHQPVGALAFQIEHAKVSWQTLLWWVVAGGAIGGFVGAVRSSRIYRQYDVKLIGSSRSRVEHDQVDIKTSQTRRRDNLHRVRWGTVWFALFVSALFHLAAGPQLFQELREYFYWGRHRLAGEQTSFLTMELSPPAPDASVKEVDLRIADMVDSVDPRSLVLIDLPERSRMRLVSQHGDRAYLVMDDELILLEDDRRQNVMQRPQFAAIVPARITVADTETTEVRVGREAPIAGSKFSQNAREEGPIGEREEKLNPSDLDARLPLGAQAAPALDTEAPAHPPRKPTRKAAPPPTPEGAVANATPSDLPTAMTEVVYVLTDDGKLWVGALVRETTAEIVLLGPSGRVTISRNKIEQMKRLDEEGPR